MPIFIIKKQLLTTNQYEESLIIASGRAHGRPVVRAAGRRKAGAGRIATTQ